MARINSRKTGTKTVVLDDLKHGLDPDFLLKPSRYIEAAFAEK